jgi:hypothetical protein
MVLLRGLLVVLGPFAYLQQRQELLAPITPVVLLARVAVALGLGRTPARLAVLLRL